MNYEEFLDKITSFAIWFFNFAMNQGENKFMLVDNDFINASDVSDQMMWMFLLSFVIVAVIAIFASDSFHPFSPHEGILMWLKKISVLKVTIFAAAIFSLHTFYKMLITILGNVIGANASVLEINCLGTFINPLSICILSIAIATLELEHGRRQALFLALSVFLTPAILTYNTITNEHLVIYTVGIIFGIAAAILYKRFSMYVTYLIMSAIYVISKFFLIFYSAQVRLITEENLGKQVFQFFACLELDIFLLLIIALILMGYKEITLDKKDRKVKKDVIGVSLMAVFVIFSVLSSKVSYVYAAEPVESKVWISLFDEVSTEMDSDQANEEYEYADVEIAYAESSSYLISKNGNEYGPEYSVDGNESTCWQDGVDGTGEGEYINYYLSETDNVGKIQIFNGNRKSEDSYYENCRIESATLNMYLDGELVNSQEIEIEDDFNQAPNEIYFEPVECDTVEMIVNSVYSGSKYDDLCISEVGIYKAY